LNALNKINAANGLKKSPVIPSKVNDSTEPSIEIEKKFRGSTSKSKDSLFGKMSARKQKQR
jgi:hypothetical protein